MDWYFDGAGCDQEWEWVSIFENEAMAEDLNLECGKNMKTYMRSSALEIIELKTYRWPWGTWLAEARQPESNRLGDLSSSTWLMFNGMVTKLFSGKAYTEHHIIELQAEANQRLHNGENKYR